MSDDSKTPYIKTLFGPDRAFGRDLAPDVAPLVPELTSADPPSTPAEVDEGPKNPAPRVRSVMPIAEDPYSQWVTWYDTTQPLKLFLPGNRFIRSIWVPSWGGFASAGFYQLYRGEGMNGEPFFQNAGTVDSSHSSSFGYANEILADLIPVEPNTKVVTIASSFTGFSTGPIRLFITERVFDPFACRGRSIVSTATPPYHSGGIGAPFIWVTGADRSRDAYTFDSSVGAVNTPYAVALFVFAFGRNGASFDFSDLQNQGFSQWDRHVDGSGLAVEAWMKVVHYGDAIDAYQVRGPSELFTFACVASHADRDVKLSSISGLGAASSDFVTGAAQPCGGPGYRHPYDTIVFGSDPYGWCTTISPDAITPTPPVYYEAAETSESLVLAFADFLVSYDAAQSINTGAIVGSDNGGYQNDPPTAEPPGRLGSTYLSGDWGDTTAHSRYPFSADPGSMPLVVYGNVTAPSDQPFFPQLTPDGFRTCGGRHDAASQSNNTLTISLTVGQADSS